MHLQRQDYIPAGCLGVFPDEKSGPTCIWEAKERVSWKRLRLQRPAEHPIESGDHDEYLSVSDQNQILQSKALNPLFLLRWIDLEFCIHQDARFGTLRVYLLPDDAHRGLVDRTNPVLQRARTRLLHSLDYSKDAWAGLRAPSGGNPSPFHRAQSRDNEGTTLLQVFNDIPSPDPGQTFVGEKFLQNAIDDIMRSEIPGLLTRLYPHQRRSAAVMLQKEEEPGTVVDPRLIAIPDQEGLLFYADPVAGTVLREPRRYDGTAGGILAEEMGAGKTLICLAIVLATRNLPTRPPEIHGVASPPTRRRIGSLADMAAACATRNGVPWKAYFETWRTQLGPEYVRCQQILRRNPGFYFAELPPMRRMSRHTVQGSTPTKLSLSSATVVVVPNNLVSQWKQEIAKHTSGLNALVLAQDEEFPSLETLLSLDVLLLSQWRLESLVNTEPHGHHWAVLRRIHFKRCIVDEGHKVGNSKIGRRSELLCGLDGLRFSSRWIATGTPSHGLFGVDDRRTSAKDAKDVQGQTQPVQVPREASTDMERKDLQRLGSIASLYLKVRPWANPSADEQQDSRADWEKYMLLPQHRKNSWGCWSCLKATLNSLIIRHRLSDVGDLLPPVDKKVVVLDGSYQDRLSLNVFAMMIIFNAVQSQRTGVDYFFHPGQRKSLLQIVHNLKQSSFFGASFFSAGQIATAVETAEKFLEEGKVPVSPQDQVLLSRAISLGRVAATDKLRNLDNRFRDLPMLLQGPLSSTNHAWSWDGEGDETVCTSAGAVLSLQKLLSMAPHNPQSLNSLLNGGSMKEGLMDRGRLLERGAAARNTKLVDPTRRRKSRTQSGDVTPFDFDKVPADSLPSSLKQTRLVSTVSAKLSYLIDAVLRHQEDEKIIIFYENENVAWYLASALEMLQVQHLIYAKSLTRERRTHYLDAFHNNEVFRVLLMDLSDAAFGLDMHEGSRIYFVNPVFNPQVEAQAIGRVRRISQQKPVFVETLVLKDSIDEVLLERKKHMTQAEHCQIKSILDLRPIYNWIKNATILDLPDVNVGDFASHMAGLQAPWPVFGKGFERQAEGDAIRTKSSPVIPTKRASEIDGNENEDERSDGDGRAARPARRVRFTD